MAKGHTEKCPTKVFFQRLAGGAVVANPLPLFKPQLICFSQSVSDHAAPLNPTVGQESKPPEELLAAVYHDLRRLAAAKMAAESPGHTLQPTALVHEAWLRLSQRDKQKFVNQTHFFASAAGAMRQILIDRARRKKSLKRGGGMQPLNLDQVDVATRADDETLLLMNEALEKLAREDSQAAQLIELRFFIGLSNEEAAQALGMSPRSAKRCWSFARAWLYREISGRAASR